MVLITLRLKRQQPTTILPEQNQPWGSWLSQEARSRIPGLALLLICYLAPLPLGVLCLELCALPSTWLFTPESEIPASKPSFRAVFPAPESSVVSPAMFPPPRRPLAPSTHSLIHSFEYLIRPTQLCQMLGSKRDKEKVAPMEWGALEKETATHSSILAWRIPWTEVPGCYSPWGPKESDAT